MKPKSERGAIMVESTYCILLALFVLFFMLSFGFRLYQETVVGIVANEVAEEVVLNYKILDITDSTQVTQTKVEKVSYFRYLFGGSNYTKANESKGESIAKTRLTATDLNKDQGALDVKIKPVKDGVGRRHYEVTVQKRYSFLLGDLLKVIGLNGTEVISATVYVESVDVLGYANTIKLTQYMINKVAQKSVVLKYIETAIKLVESIVN